MAEDYSVTTTDKLLKVVYNKKESVDQVLNDFPSLGLMQRVNKFNGKNYQPSMYGAGGQGVATDFASAKANRTAGTSLQPVITRGRIYGFAQLEAEAMLACKGDDGAYIDLVKQSKKDIDRAMRRHMGGFLFGDGGGAFGQIKAGSAVNTTTLELRDPNSVVFFENKMRLELSTTSGRTGAVEAGFATIVAVNRAEGKLILDQAITTAIPTATNAMYVFVKGNHSAQYGGKVITGIPGWIPRTDPVYGVDNFFGMDRGIDPFRFAGVRYLGGGATIREAITAGLWTAGREGCAPKTGLLNPLDYGMLAYSIENKSSEVTLQARDAKVGYTGIKMHAPSLSGSVNFVADASVPVGDCWILDFDDWQFRYIADSDMFPEVVQNDGRVLERIDDADAFALRFRGLGNVICHRPANQLYIKLPTAA